MKRLSDQQFERLIHEFRKTHAGREAIPPGTGFPQRVARHLDASATTDETPYAAWLLPRFACCCILAACCSLTLLPGDGWELVTDGLSSQLALSMDPAFSAYEFL